MSYTLTQADYRGLKRRQSLYRNRFNKARTAYLNNRNDSTVADAAEKAARDLISVSENGLRAFEEKGYPDSWADWQRDLEDAEVLLRYHF